MIAVLQRVSEAAVKIDGAVYSEIGRGIMILLGVAEEDTEEDVRLLTEKIPKLRIFEDEEGKMNLSLTDVNGELLVVSNFTLLAAYRKGNRPDYMNAARPEKAIPLYEAFISQIHEKVPVVQHGVFGADMKLSLTNDGPVTIVMDSNVLKQPKR
ncbi:MAG: D-tyrosyl-tRNA(Tyr) deacylase [Clostridia bacterium]|nr:D-tyrosyl-tRNA(Tyr) deacylase [Clostridia bacterium]